MKPCACHTKRWKPLAGGFCILSMMVLFDGCNVLAGLFPGLGGGAITVKRIVTTDPLNTVTPIVFPLAPVPLDGLGFRWDLEDDGHVTDGGSADFPDAFDNIMEYELFVPGFAEHEFEPGTLIAAVEDGREYVIGPVAEDGGLMITRKIFVSPDHGFARWLDIIANPTDTDVTLESENKGNLGSDESNDNVFASSNGNTTLEEGDIWWINGQQFASDPTVAAFFCGTKDTEKDQDSVVFDYGKTQLVKAHSRNILATYLFQRAPDRSSPTSLLVQETTIVSDLQTLMRSLETFPDVDPAYLSGMTAAEVNDLRNCGGNVSVSGARLAVTPGAMVTVTDTNTGSSRSGTARSDGSFGPLNVVGAAGDSVQITANGITSTKTVP